MPNFTGGCACGAVRYQANSEPAFSFHCYCRDCQQATGSGHASLMIFAAEHFACEGPIKFTDTKADSGNTVSRGICAKCASPVMTKNNGYPENRYVCAGSLDDPGLFKPERAVWVGSAQKWDPVPNSLVTQPT